MATTNASPELNDKTSENTLVTASHLNDSEKQIIETQVQLPQATISYFSLYQYANKKEIVVIIVASIAAVAAGAVMPLMTLVFGNYAGSFTGYVFDSTAIKHFNDQIRTFTLYFVYLGIGSFVTSYISILGFTYTGERITQRIRERYLRAIFSQNIAFFDFLGSGEVTTRISADMNLVEDGISQKVGLFMKGCSIFVTAIIVGFVRSWKLALIMLSCTVAILLAMSFNGRFMRINQTRSVDAYATAGTLAEEVLSSARDVTAFGTQNRLDRKYVGMLKVAGGYDYKSRMFLGLMIATMLCIVNLQYGLAFWQGNRFFHNGELGVAQILTVVMASMMAGISIGQALPHLGAFTHATAAATKIFNTIERKSPIDPDAEEGDKPEKVTGNIEFKNVKHLYPSRPDTIILHNFSLAIPAGKMTALVGTSGSGKSTIFGLLERFYLPMTGDIFLDGREINTLNLKWLRRNMAIVSQDPVLFSLTIRESIAHGLIGTDYEDANEDVKTNLIENAARMANAYDFISQLPQGFHTRVGERGSLLSGGQKQRIAIARAVVSDPKILLLDEATASLDTRSESLVQEALDRASKGRTTIVIAHRLSTIKNADNIVVMAHGRIVEQGTHEQLLAMRSMYHTLVEAQELRSKIQPAGDGKANEEDIQEKDGLDLLKSVTSVPETTHGAAVAHKDVDYSTWQLVKFTWGLNHNEKKIMYFGLIFAILAGFAFPVQSIFFGNVINGLRDPSSTTGHHSISFWCLMFLMLGLSVLLFNALQGIALAWGSARLVERARELAFRAILRQDIEFFDADNVTSGSLASFLSVEANRLAGISGANLGTILVSTSTIVGALAISIPFGWKLALVCAACMPILLGCGYFRFWTLLQLEKRTKKTNDAASFACEAAASIRTVASLTLEQHLLGTYHEKLQQQTIGNSRFKLLSSLLYGLSESLPLFVQALSFWYGGKLILSGEYTAVQFFICFAAVINGAQSAGAIFSFAPDMGEARSAAQLLKSLLVRVPKIDHWSTEGKMIDTLEGKIEFQDVRFTYPSRPDQRILRGVNITASPGQFVALVGASGSGKSTCMALLERFYDQASGSILIDDVELPSYNLQSYRSQVAIVSQETTLYTGTIRENILADKEDVTDAAIEKACKDANIYDFIASLPDGFNTLVGAKGQLLSGGQRQRLAIARALLRDPKILLLDEATSSLDSTSEAAVQAALDQAAKGRTTVAIAHRLSTTQHADCIYVFERGKVVEQGRHDELMARRGFYWELARLQELGA